MTYRPAPGDDVQWLSDEMMTGGTRSRRIFGFLIDGLIVLVLWKLCALALLLFGILTLGLGMPLLGLLPFLPAIYNFVFLLSPLSATPGQAMLGLIVRRNDNLGPPTGFAAIIWVLGFYVSWALSGVPFLLALFSQRRRTLHDIASGLVVVHARALTGGAGFVNMGPGGPPFA